MKGACLDNVAILEFRKNEKYFKYVMKNVNCW